MGGRLITYNAVLFLTIDKKTPNYLHRTDRFCFLPVSIIIFFYEILNIKGHIPQLRIDKKYWINKMRWYFRGILRDFVKNFWIFEFSDFFEISKFLKFQKIFWNFEFCEIFWKNKMKFCGVLQREKMNIKKKLIKRQNEDLWRFILQVSQYKSKLQLSMKIPQPSMEIRKKFGKLTFLSETTTISDLNRQ